jgi:hypothetical protein
MFLGSVRVAVLTVEGKIASFTFSWWSLSRLESLDGALGEAGQHPALGEQVDDDRGRHCHQV